MNKSEFAEMLRTLAEALDGMPESEFEALLGNSHQRSVSAPKSSKAKKKISDNSKVTDDELKQLLPELQRCATREDVREVLQKDPRVLLKDNLERLAKLLKVHVNKHDKREVIEEKVVESAIGVRLRSEAILGLNLKGSSSNET